MMQLLSVACLSLAAKMEETQVPLSLDLQVQIHSKFYSLIYYFGENQLGIHICINNNGVFCLVILIQVAESRFLFEGRTIQRMELLVMSTLKWRMQAITAFSFIDHFIRKNNDVNSHRIPLKDSVFRSTQIIIATLKGSFFYLLYIYLLSLLLCCDDNLRMDCKLWVLMLLWWVWQ